MELVDECEEEGGGLTALDECLAFYDTQDGATAAALSLMLRDCAARCQDEGLDFLGLAQEACILELHRVEAA